MELKCLYEKAAEKAFKDGIDAGNEPQLIKWINNNCTYYEDRLFFLVLGIGSHLADLQAQALGYKSEVDRAFTLAESKLNKR